VAIRDAPLKSQRRVPGVRQGFEDQFTNEKEATIMKLLAMFGTTALALVLGMSAPVYAQQDEAHPQEEKRAQPDEKAAHEQDKQQDKQEEKQVEKEKESKQVDKDKDDKRAVQDEKAEHPEARPEERADQREGKPAGGRIPDDRFRANFGREHTFHIGRPVIVAGAPRFQYGGYWFVIAQPWPVGWAYTDVVYVDYINGGYYLLSPVHPGVQLSINVIL
jgi:hypothetical protein